MGYQRAMSGDDTARAQIREARREKEEQSEAQIQEARRASARESVEAEEEEKEAEGECWMSLWDDVSSEMAVTLDVLPVQNTTSNDDDDAKHEHEVAISAVKAVEQACL